MNGLIIRGLANARNSLLLLILVTAVVGCSGGGGDDGVDGTGLKGTAATGSPIRNAPVIVKDANGRKERLTTDTNGKWGIEAQDMGGLTPPFIIKVEINSDESIFSLATERGFANVTPISDVAARNWFKSRGRDIEDEHDDANPIFNPPTKTDFDDLKESIENLFRVAFSEFNLPQGFDFIKSRFDADHTGFDGLLDHLKVTIANDRVIILIRDPEYGFLGRIIFDFDLHDDLTDVDDTPPSDPANLIAVPASPTEMILVWNSSTDNVGVAGYKIYRDGVEIAESPYPVYIDASLTAGIEYCYEVEAIDGSGNVSENRSPEVCKSTLNQADITAPDAPATLTATATGENTIDLAWLPSPQDDVLGYHVYRTTTSGNIGEKIVTVVGSTYIDSGLDAGVEYCYTVKAFDAVPNLSDFSGESCETTFGDTTAPEAPLVAPIAAFTNEPSIQVTGTAEVGSLVTVNGGANTVTTTAGSNGVFSVDVPLTLNELNSLSVFATDAFNNDSPITTVDTSDNPLEITQDGVSPAVSTVDPADGDFGVSLSSNIVITFSENISTASVVPANISLRQGANSISSTLVHAGNQVTINPSSTLDPDTLFTVSVFAAGILDEAGNAMVSDFSSTFTTLNDNNAPTADAGLNQTVAKNTTVNLNGNGSDDPDGDSLTYQWMVVQQPAGSNISLVSPGSATPSFVPQVTGNYTIQLIVNDGSVDSSPDQIIVTANNTAPVANAGPDQPGVATSVVVNLNGSASSDANGDSLSFQWVMSSRPAGSVATLSNATSATPSFIADLRGSYQIQLVVNDGEVDSNTDTVIITALNNAPVANAGVDQPVSVDDTVTINGGSSSDSDGDPLIFAWVLLDQPLSSTVTLPANPGSSFDFVPDQAGDYTIQLIVNDGFVDSAADTVVITAAAVGTGVPTANAGADQRVGIGDTVQLDGSGSSDPDLDPLTFQWVLTDSPLGSSATLNDATLVNPTFVADVPGSYTLELVVDDGVSGSSSPDSVTIVAGLTCGILHTGTIDVAGELDFITFAAAANDVISFTMIQTAGFGGGGNLATAVIEAPSTVEFATVLANNQPELTLTETGIYTVKVRANNLLATGTYKVGMECLSPLGPTEGNLVHGDLVTSTISQPGEQDLYTFDGTAGDMVSLTLVQTLGFGSGGNVARATVFRSDGTEVTTFVANSQPEIILPATDTYTIQINASAFIATGTYKIGLEFLSSLGSPIDGTLVHGDLVSSTISEAGEQDLYTFSGEAGNTVSLTLVQTAGFGGGGNLARVTVFRSDGTQVTTFTANSQVEFILPATDTYTLQINASAFIATGTYSIGLEFLSPLGSPVDGVLVHGDLVTSTISQPGEQDLYTFSGSIGDVVSMTLVQTAGFGSGGNVARATVFRSDGTQVTTFVANSQPEIILPATDTYTLQINASGFIATGTYKVGLEFLSPLGAPIDGTLAHGDVITSNITESGEQDLYTFSGEAGNTVSLTLVQTAGFGGGGNLARVTVFRSDGTQVTTFTANSQVELILPATDTYTLQINASAFIATGTYKVGLEFLDPLGATDGTLVHGDLITGSIAESGEQDLYTFDGTAGDMVSLTLVQTLGFGSGGNVARATVFRSDGTEVTTFVANSQPEIILPATDTYTIQINASAFIATGTYKIGLEFLSSLGSPIDGTLVHGDLVSSTISEAGEQDLYTFSGEAGNTVSLTLVQTAGFGGGGNLARVTVFRSDGTQVTTFTANSQVEFILPATDTYTLQINASAFIATGTYSIGLEFLSPLGSPVDGALVHGDLILSTITSPGEQDLYTFSGSIGDVVSMTLVQTTGFGSGGNVARATVFRSDGTQVTTFVANSQPEIILPATDTYTIQINASAFIATGTYRLGLEFLSPLGSPIDGALSVPDSVIAATIDFPGEQDLYTFSGSVGETVSITLAQTAGFGGGGNLAVATVFSSDGTEVSFFTANNTVDIVLPATDTYTIQVRANALIATGTYNLTLN